MDQVNSSFFVPKENFAEVIKAIHNLALAKDKTTEGSSLNSRYRWIDEGFEKINDIKELFSYWRWEIFFDQEGDITDISFAGEKLGSDSVFFNAIAPYVREDSFIQMSGEGDDQWRWFFDGKTCVEQHPKITIWE
jgi:hypothetical protein